MHGTDPVRSTARADLPARVRLKDINNSHSPDQIDRLDV